MTADVASPNARRRRLRSSQLRVVFDTNALYVTPNSFGSASDLVTAEIATLISETRHPDLEIHWYLPEIVRHERQYQMQTESLKLRTAIARIERLLDHNVALTDQALIDHVRARLEEKEGELGLEEIRLDHSLVDWSRLIDAAAYRKPPFQAGEKEKGFRDALIAESFLQLVAASPRTPDLCRLVLVTNDERLTTAVRERIAASPNASVSASIEELKGLINTIVSNVGEDFIAALKPKAEKMFFTLPDEKDAVFYKEEIRKRLTEKFQSELAAQPPGTSFRTNGKWGIDRPNFVKKNGRRVFWASRIEIEVEAGNIIQEAEPEKAFFGLAHPVSVSPGYFLAPTADAPLFTIDPSYSNLTNVMKMAPVSSGRTLGGFVPGRQLVSHKGVDVFEVLWSVELTMAKDFRKPVIEDILHVGFAYQAVAP